MTGVDVPPSAFVDKLRRNAGAYPRMSGLYPSFTSMKETIEVIRAAGLREKVKIIIGGGLLMKR
jgi:5-methyltetrahydrofolate--homocysteine methyltransferase